MVDKFKKRGTECHDLQNLGLLIRRIVTEHKLSGVRKLHSTFMRVCISRRIKGRKHRHTAWTALTYVVSPLSFNSEDKQEVHGSHVLLVVTLSACVVGCFSSLLQYTPPCEG